MIHLLLVNLSPEVEWRTWRAARNVWEGQVCLQSAQDVETALAILSHAPPYEQGDCPSLVFLGTGAYGVWEPAALRRLRSALTHQHVPLVGLADTSQALERLRAQRAPLDAVILSPVQPDALREVAETLRVNHTYPIPQQNPLNRDKRLLPFSLSIFSDAAVQIGAQLADIRLPTTRLAWQWLVVALLIVSLAIGGVTEASAASLPGDVLYPVKLTVQQVRLTLTRDEGARQKLAEQFNARQLQDIQIAEKTGRRAQVEFQGDLQQIDGNTWSVDGLIVKLQPGTRLGGQRPGLGARVVVKGYLPGDGSLVATDMAVVSEGHNGPPQTTEEPTLTSTATPNDVGTDDSESKHPSEATDAPKPTREPKATPESKAAPGPKATHEPNGPPPDKSGRGPKSNGK